MRGLPARSRYECGNKRINDAGQDLLGRWPGKVEEQINHWFENEAGAVYVVKTETVAVVAERRDSEASPFIIVTIWYELG